MLALAKHPIVEKYDLSSVQNMMSAAAPLSVELREEVEKRFKKKWGTEVYGTQAWGMTETSPLACAVAGPWKKTKRHTVGDISPNIEFRVVDSETMEDMPFDEKEGRSKAGEMLLRGPNVTEGYYRNEKATKEAMWVDAEGREWLRTGDIGTIDKDGFVNIVDRIKEMIKYKGFQVIPSELEGKLLEHEDVEDSCVVGVYVENMATEVPVGFVVVKKGVVERSSREEVARRVKEWLEGRIAGHKRCRGGVHVIDEVPKSASGKILRRQLKKEWEERVRETCHREQAKL